MSRIDFLTPRELIEGAPERAARRRENRESFVQGKLVKMDGKHRRSYSEERRGLWGATSRVRKSEFSEQDQAVVVLGININDDLAYSHPEYKNCIQTAKKTLNTWQTIRFQLRYLLVFIKTCIISRSDEEHYKALTKEIRKFYPINHHRRIVSEVSAKALEEKVIATWVREQREFFQNQRQELLRSLSEFKIIKGRSTSLPIVKAAPSASPVVQQPVQILVESPKVPPASPVVQQPVQIPAAPVVPKAPPALVVQQPAQIPAAPPAAPVVPKAPPAPVVQQPVQKPAQILVEPPKVPPAPPAAPVVPKAPPAPVVQQPAQIPAALSASETKPSRAALLASIRALRTDPLDATEEEPKYSAAPVVQQPVVEAAAPAVPSEQRPSVAAPADLLQAIRKGTQLKTFVASKVPVSLSNEGYLASRLLDRAASIRVEEEQEEEIETEERDPLESIAAVATRSDARTAKKNWGGNAATTILSQSTQPMDLGSIMNAINLGNVEASSSAEEVSNDEWFD